MTLTCNRLLATHAELWHDATVHPFLVQCQQGQIRPEQFNTWLVQDFHFVLGFTRLAASLLQSAPADHMDLLLGGMGFLKDELLWFQKKASDRQLSLAQPLQPTCKAYCQFMEALRQRPYPVKAAGFWAIERAYNQAWQEHSPMVPAYAEFADRWGNAAFTDYVKQLAVQADEALAESDTDTQIAAEAVFVRVAELEKDFWQMAFSTD